MADHIDGPRSIGDPSIDLTDLFAFTSPENPERFVLALDVFPSAGASAMFSNVANHAIVVRRATVAGLGEAAVFETGDQEFRFACRFDVTRTGARRRSADPACHPDLPRRADSEIHCQ